MVGPPSSRWHVLGDPSAVTYPPLLQRKHLSTLRTRETIEVRPTSSDNTSRHTRVSPSKRHRRMQRQTVAQADYFTQCKPTSSQSNQRYDCEFAATDHQVPYNSL